MNRFCVTLILVVILPCVAREARAALNLSVTPLSGGNDLRFGRVSSQEQVNREVRIRITATDEKQYQVFHRVVDAFLNEQGAPLAADALSTYTLLGSNAAGTLYAQNVERLGPSDQLLYSSSAGGDSDAFTVVYAVDASRINTSGNYLGRIQYIARPIGGSSQDTAILNATLETSGEFKVEVEGSSTGDSVRLNLNNESDREGYVRIAFQENRENPIRVYQEVEPYLQDELFNEMDPRAVLFVTSGDSPADLQPRVPTELARRRVAVYSSQQDKDSFRVHFTLDAQAVERQKAGVYKGGLRYIVEAQGRENTYNIQLEVEVEPVFALEVDLPAQGLSFERLLPDSQPVVREVGVTVKTNLGRPYLVMQNVVSPLTNETGDMIPEEYFTLKGELLEGATGKIPATDFQKAPQGEGALFYSDPHGSPSHFRISYRLRPYATMVPGDYTTSIRYSLGEL